MPRYYFHLQDGSSRLTDEEGVVLPDKEAAWYQAVRSARELINHDMRYGTLRHGRFVEIADEMGRPVSQLPFDELVGIA